MEETKPLSKLEVEALIQEQISPITTAINPDSAPYLSVDHFFTTITIFIVIMGGIMGYLWTKMCSNNTAINDRVTGSNQRIHERIDSTNDDIEERENGLREECSQNEKNLRDEFNEKHNRLDDRLWELKGKDK